MKTCVTFFLLWLCMFAAPVHADDLECVRNNCMGTCITRQEAMSKPVPMICRAQYMCYQDAECLKQEDGTCGWKETAELKRCIAEKAKPTTPPSSTAR